MLSVLASQERQDGVPIVLRTSVCRFVCLASMYVLQFSVLRYAERVERALFDGDGDHGGCALCVLMGALAMVL